MSSQESKLMRRRMANAYLSSVVSIALVLMLIGLAATLIVNARSVSDYFKENLQVSVLLKPEVSDSKAENLEQSLQTLPYVKATRLVSREEGTEDLKKMLGEDFLSVFETSPVPVSVELTLKAEYVSSDSIEVVKSLLSSYPEVDEVDCQQSLVEALTSNMAKISAVLTVFILLLLFISFVLISNTVRLAVYSRRFTIYTMKMVGATRSFIRKPFLISSIWQGLVASAIALAVLGMAMLFLRRSFAQLFAILRTDMLAVVALIVVACGVLICLASTFFVVGRLLSRSKDDLYY